jgi:hypothetical protein
MMRWGDEARWQRGAARGVSKMGFCMLAGVHNSRPEVKTGGENPHGRVIFVTILKGPGNSAFNAGAFGELDAGARAV